MGTRWQISSSPFLLSSASVSTPVATWVATRLDECRLASSGRAASAMYKRASGRHQGRWPIDTPPSDMQGYGLHTAFLQVEAVVFRGVRWIVGRDHAGPSLRRRRLSIVVVLLSAVVYLVGCGGPRSAPRPASAVLRLGVATSLAPPVPNSVLWLAQDEGFYRREGLDVSLLALDGTPRVVTAMMTGDIDVGNVSTDQVLQLNASGRADLRALHSPDPRQFLLLASSARIDRIERLRGSTLAISAIGSLDDTTTRRLLRAKGVAVSDLDLVALGDPSARAAALVAGRVDATTISIGTWSTISTATGVHVLVSPEEYFQAAPLVAKVDAVTAAVLAAKREPLRRFTRAVIRAVRYFAEHRQAWVDAMARRRQELDRPMLAALWDRFRGHWAVDGGMDPGQLNATADILYGSSELRALPRVPIARWTDQPDLEIVLAQLRRM